MSPLATSRTREFAVVDRCLHEAEVARREIDCVPDRAPTGNVGHSVVTETFAPDALVRVYAHATLRNDCLHSGPCAKSRAVARPMPLAHPVIRATLPSIERLSADSLAIWPTLVSYDVGCSC